MGTTITLLRSNTLLATPAPTQQSQTQ
jgi:hypothetical protein